MFKKPHWGSSSIWLGWTYGSENQTKSTVIERIPSLLTPFGKWATMNQTHSNIVHTTQVIGSVGVGDGLITEQFGLGLVAQTADCVPVFLVGGGKDCPQVAVIHAGWRGIANQIIIKAIEKMDDVHTAIIGPCIGVNRYEVGEEVIQLMIDAGIPREICTQDRSPRPHLDCRLAVAHQLRNAQVRRIETNGSCTFTDTGWASYRRDKVQSGRILSVIGIVESI